MRKFLHKLGCHQMSVIGWTVMGNPVEKCSMCEYRTYTVGSINPRPQEITKEQAEELIFHPE